MVIMFMTIIIKCSFPQDIEGNVAEEFDKEKKFIFSPSFIASSVRVVTKTGYYMGLRFELYGCGRLPSC